MIIPDELTEFGEVAERLQVSLSNEIIHLLSEQLYTSPLKAIEELVVNAYDADAMECRIGIPPPENPEQGFIAVYDDGTGMHLDGLRMLWHIGGSPKRLVESQSTQRHRRVIGKFGIGKLATYAVANRITYVTRHGNVVFHVICDYRQFRSDPQGGRTPVSLDVRKVSDLTTLAKWDAFRTICEAVGVDPQDLANGNSPTWTLCLLDELKPKARELKLGRLRWVLRTAMPLKSDFAVYVNAERIESSKENLGIVVKFGVGDISEGRLESLGKKYDVEWQRKDGGVYSRSLFPNGIQGDVIVAQESLATGKAGELIGRSHGFFVRVRGRLVNEDDPLFGNSPLSFQVFNRFRADLSVDDLHENVTAPREGVEAGRRRDVLSAFARELFNEAREAYDRKIKEEDEQEKRKRESDRSYVAPRLVERPMADVLAIFGPSDGGAEPDDGWFYIRDTDPSALRKVVE